MIGNFVLANAFLQGYSSWFQTDQHSQSVSFTHLNKISYTSEKWAIKHTIYFCKTYSRLKTLFNKPVHIVTVDVVPCDKKAGSFRIQSTLLNEHLKFWMSIFISIFVIVTVCIVSNTCLPKSKVNTWIWWSFVCEWETKFKRCCSINFAHTLMNFISQFSSSVGIVRADIIVKQNGWIFRNRKNIHFAASKQEIKIILLKITENNSKKSDE